MLPNNLLLPLLLSIFINGSKAATTISHQTSLSRTVYADVTAIPVINIQKRAGAAPPVGVIGSITGNGQSITDSKPTAVITSAKHDDNAKSNSDSNSNNADSPPPLPTLPSTGVPVPTITVPPLGNNPFIQQSNLPEGTVFIAVGAILGGIGLALITWRIVAAQALRSSIRKSEAAALLSEQDDHKPPIFSAVNASKRSGRDSMNHPNFSNENLAPPFGVGTNRNTLFFSPTTEVMNMGKEGSTNSMLGGSVGIGGLTSSGTGGGSLTSNLGIMPTQTTRSSVYLPSGYYGVGNTNGNGGSAGSFTSRSIRPMSMAARESMYGPGSASMDQMSERNSTFTSMLPRTNINNRAPSAFLDDLLARDEDD